MGPYFLGNLVGQAEAYGMVAGRCSAAQAATLRYIRNYRVYKSASNNWKEFCSHYLKMSGAQADYIIRLYDQFGGDYFELAQLTRVSVETYRAMEPHIENHVLHYMGEVIPLHREIAGKLADAVEEFGR
jgi:hypothetical protein